MKNGGRIGAFVGLALAAVVVRSSPIQDHNYVPPEGYVPDGTTARSIAVAVLTPVYGKKAIDRQLPFEVRLEKGIWTVEGSIPDGGSPESYIGGTALVRISKKTGAILRMTHGR